MDKTTNETLIALFEMLNERLYNIEQSNNTIINHLKNKCINDGMLDKDLFGYPINISIIHHGDWDYPTQEQKLTNGAYAYITLNIHDTDCDRSNDSYYPMYTVHFDKVKPMLEDVLSASQIQAINKKRDNVDINQEDIKCCDLGIEDINVYVHDYLANLYIRSKFPKVERVLLNVTENYNDIIIKDAHTIDEVLSCACDVYDMLHLPLTSVASPRNRMFVCICPNTYFINLEMLLNNIDCEHIALYLSIPNDILLQYVNTMKNLKNVRYAKNHLWLNDESSFEVALGTLKDLCN